MTTVLALAAAGTAAPVAAQTAERGGGAAALDPPQPQPQALLSYTVVDGVSVPEPLTGQPGDAERGRRLYLAPRQIDGRPASCRACHQISGVTDAAAAEDGAGSGPSLDGVGLRLSRGALRLWIVNPSLRTEGSVMPAYYSLSDGVPEGAALRATPALTAQEIEDLVAFLDQVGR